MPIRCTTNSYHSIQTTPLIEENSSATCAVLLASYNGATFLAEQIESIRLQNYAHIHVFISDDGSVDQTHQIIDEQIAQSFKLPLHTRKGPKKGYASNFISLICAPDIEADYFAFADQDDIWEPDKLSRAITQLQTISADIPALYGSRTLLIDSTGKKIGLSTLFTKKPSFQNALVQCIAGGNTMVMNKAARMLLMQTRDASVFGHDWWAYLVITGAGGTVFYDAHPTTLYRQHTDSLLGRNNNWPGRLRRIHLLFQGRFRKWNTLNCAALHQYRHLLTPINQQILDEFSKARDQGLFSRLMGVWRSGVYRQTFMGNLGMYIAVLLKKL